MTLDTLRRSRFTAGLPEHQLAKLAELAREVTFADDQLIVPAGEGSAEFYLVLSGSVCVEFRTPVYIVLIQVLRPGEAFGWSSFLDHHATLFQVRAREASTGLCWDSAQLSAACREDRDLGLELFHRLLGLVAERVEATESRLAEFCGMARPPVRV